MGHAGLRGEGFLTLRRPAAVGYRPLPCATSDGSAKSNHLHPSNRGATMSLGVAEFDYLRALVKEHTAIVLDAGKEYLAETRLAPLLPEQGCDSVQELVGVLRRQPFNGLHRKVLNSMTNNETWFFRDANCFAALTGMVLPEMIKRRAQERKLAIWSAACSSGQEPYSIAMAICEQFNL